MSVRLTVCGVSVNAARSWFRVRGVRAGLVLNRFMLKPLFPSVSSCAAYCKALCDKQCQAGLYIPACLSDCQRELTAVVAAGGDADY